MNAAPASFKLKIVTPKKVELNQEVSFVKLPGIAGEIGVLPSHTATLAKLKAGIVIYTDTKGNEKRLFIRHGMSQILQGEVVVLTPFVENPTHIDFERAERAKTRALEILEKSKSAEEKETARQSLLRAEHRLSLLEKVQAEKA